jgi:hypothetical protein
MTTKYMKGGANAILTAVLGIASFAGAIVAPTLYIGGMKTDISNTQLRVGHLEDDQKASVAVVGALTNDMAIVKVDVAVGRQLLQDLSKDRFQYNPTSSILKGIRTASSSDDISLK